MARTISTGIVDIQLIGLPDVKRQLKDVPRLMDGVARATINFDRQMSKAMRSANSSLRENRQKWARTKREMTQYAEENLAAGHITRGEYNRAIKEADAAGRRAFTKFGGIRERAEVEREGQFKLSAVAGLGQFRESVLGTKALATLQQEKVALTELAQRINMADDANKAFIDGEMARIAASEKAINLERQRVLKPQEFARQERIKEAGVGMASRLDSFKELATQEKATQQLEAKRVALRQMAQEMDNSDETSRAFVASMQKEFEFEEKSIATKKKIGEQIVVQSRKRAELMAIQARGNQLTSEQQRTLKGVNKELDRLAAEFDQAEREAAQFRVAIGGTNQQLHAFKKGSRLGNYQMQQLSFAAQDMVQVWGQTGFAGALHASANNLSMFVQTLKIASPAMLGLAAFGITAGMIALSEILKMNTDRTKSFREALERTNDTLDRQHRILSKLASLRPGQTGTLADMTRQSAHASAKAQRGLRTLHMSTPTDFAGEFVDKTSSTLPGRMVGGKEQLRQAMLLRTRQMTADAATSKKLDAEMAAARQQFIKSWINAAVTRRGFLTREEREYEEYIAAMQFDAATHDENVFRAMKEAGVDKEMIEKFRALADDAEDARQALKKASDFFARFGYMTDQTDVALANFIVDIENLSQTGMEQLGGAIVDRARSFKPAMTAAESRTKDYSGAIDRLRQEAADLEFFLAQHTSDEAAVSAVLDKYRQKIIELQNEIGKRAVAERKAREKAEKEQASRNAMARSFTQDRFDRQKAQVNAEAAKAIAGVMTSGMRPAEKQTERDRIQAERKRRIETIDRERKQAKMADFFAGLQTSGVEGQIIGINERLIEALSRISDSKLLNQDEKVAAAGIARANAEQAKKVATSGAQKLGFADAKSLHKQIQMSLSPPRSEKLLEMQNEKIDEQTGILDELNQKLPAPVGP